VYLVILDLVILRDRWALGHSDGAKTLPCDTGFVQMEPPEQFTAWLLGVYYGGPFVAFYIGVFICYEVIHDAPGWRFFTKQCLVGLPVSAVVIALFMVSYFESYIKSFWQILLTYGIMMYHGILVNDTFAQHIEAVRKRRQDIPE
jgi:hypothetical protein